MKSSAFWWSVPCLTLLGAFGFRGSDPARAGGQTGPAILAIVGRPAQPADGNYMAQWNRLAAHKDSLGLPMQIVQLRDILATTPGTDNAEKVKNYLRQQKVLNWDTLQYAIVGENFDDGVLGSTTGDRYGQPRVQEVFPVRYMRGTGGAREIKPCSLQYYGDLYNWKGEPSTWDTDGDGLFGEVAEDEYDLYMEPLQGDIFVGYLPVMSKNPGDPGYENSHRTLGAMVDKIIAYETPGGPKQPRLEAGNWFLNIPLFGANNYGGPNRWPELNCRSIRDRIIRPAQGRLPVGAQFNPIAHFLTLLPGTNTEVPLDADNNPGRLGNPATTEVAIGHYCDRVSEGAGFVESSGHGGIGGNAGINDGGQPGDEFEFINDNWRGYRGEFRNWNGPYPIAIYVCSMVGWTDRYTDGAYENPPPNPLVWWEWGRQSLIETLVMANAGPTPPPEEGVLPYTPHGFVAAIGSSRVRMRDPGIAFGFLTAYMQGRASRFGEIFSEADKLYLNRQDLWRPQDPAWKGANYTDGEYWRNQYEETYVGDPSLKLPAIPPLAAAFPPLYADQAGDAGLGSLTGNVTSAAAADLDGDGIDDLVLGAGSGSSWSVRIFRGGAAYAQVAEIPSAGDAVKGVFLSDVDGDGDLDLFAANEGSDRLYLNLGGWSFSADAAPAWGIAGSGQTADAAFRDLDLDGRVDLALVEGGVLKVFRNDIGGRFIDRTAAWMPGGPALATALSVADYNRDGLPDLFVGSDPAGGSRFYVGVDEGEWVESLSRVTGSYFSGRVEGADWADFDADGDPDLHVQLTASPELEPSGLPDLVLEQVGGGRLDLHAFPMFSGDIQHKGATWDFVPYDVNLDSRPDGVYFNRFGTKLAQNRWGWEFASTVGADGLDYSERMRDGCLVDPGSGYPAILGVRYGAHNGPHPYGAIRYWRRQESPNQFVGPNHWIRLRLRGAGMQGLSHTDALGARVTVVSDREGGEYPLTQTQELTADGHSAGLVFGLFQNTRLDSIRIEWPSGLVQNLDVDAGTVDRAFFAQETAPAGTTRPAEVQGLRAEAALPAWDRVNLFWTPNPPGDQVQQYEIWRSVDSGSFVWLQTVAGTSTSYPDVLVVPGDWGKTHSYRIRAVNGWGKGAWSNATPGLYLEPRPERPSQVGVILVGVGQDVHLNWEPPVQGNPVGYYQVYRWPPLSPDPVPVGAQIPPQPYGQGIVLPGAGGNDLYGVVAGNAYGSKLPLGSKPAAFYDTLRILPAGGDLHAPAGTRVQLRAYLPDQSGDGSDVPVTHALVTGWTSNRPMENPITPPNSGGLVCNVAGPTTVTATFGQMQAQETYNVILQNPIAPPKGAGPAKQEGKR